MPDAPQLSAISPDSAPAGTGLTLTGSGFGTRNDASTVRFRVPVEGAAPVAGSIVDWVDDTIRVQVPALASFDSGGPLTVSVHTDDGDSATLPFILEEDSPPSLAAIHPGRGLDHDTVTLTGERFGRPTSASAVLFQAPGPTDVPP